MAGNLSTTYLGIQLANPFVVAACPLTRESTRLQKVEQAGAAAAVMYSVFAEQITSDELTRVGSSKQATAAKNNAALLTHQFIGGVDDYLRQIELARKSVSIPIIGSLNGARMGEWVNFARLIEQAGVDALELNVYFVPTDPSATGQQVEQEYLDIVAAVQNQISIPLAVKLGPFFSSLPNFAARLVDLGVTGIVLFNRFLQPDIDPDTFDVTPQLKLSSRSELRLPLRWIAILRPQLQISIAASTGAHTGQDAAKLILAGADVVSIASALMRNGPSYMATMIEDFSRYMTEKGFQSVEQMRGLAIERLRPDSDAIERANYIKTIDSYEDE